MLKIIHIFMPNFQVLMNTLELDVVIISTDLIDIFSFFEIFNSSSECSSFKCFRNSISSTLLDLKSHEGNTQSKFNKMSIII